MKKILISIILIALIFSVKAQTLFPVNQGVGNASQNNLLYTINGGGYATVGFIESKYADTTSANLNSYLKWYAGSRFYSTSDDAVWVRNAAKTMWLKQATGTSGAGTVTSVALTMPSAFTVGGSPITTSGTLAVTGAGTTSQYIRGDGSLATYGTATSVPLSGITAAIATNDIDNANYQQEWRWDALTATGMKFTTRSTASAANSTFISMERSGTHATANRSTYVLNISNKSQGTNTLNNGILINIDSNSNTTSGGKGVWSITGANSNKSTALYGIANGDGGNGVVADYGGQFSGTGLYAIAQSGAMDLSAAPIFQRATKSIAYSSRDIGAYDLTNVGLYAAALNGQYNYAIIVPADSGQVGFGTASPNASSLLDITSTTKGLLIPRMTAAQKTAISTPATGLLIFQTDATAGFYYYTGAAWVALAGWSLTGNASTAVATNFIGTTDNIGLKFKTNNIQSGYIDLVNNNTSFGNSSLLANTSGAQNVAFGENALISNQDGIGNVAVGRGALNDNVSGDFNVGLGLSSLTQATSDGNTAIGYQALQRISTGTYNIGIGYGAGSRFSDESNRLFINNELKASKLLDSTESIIYGAMDATAATQRLYFNSQVYMPYLTNLSTQNRILGQFGTDGKTGYITVGSGLSLASGELTATATATTWNGIANPTGAQALTFQAGENSVWTDQNTTADLLTINNATQTTASMLSLNRTSTALASGNNIGEFISSGVNGTNAITATGLNVSVTNTNGTSGTNVGLSVTASGATTGNYGIIVPSGFVGLYQSTPTSKLQLNHDANSVTQADANGLLIANATAATAGLQSISPPLILQGNGWKTNATAASQDVRFRMQVLPVQAAANPSSIFQLQSSINAGAYTTPFEFTSGGAFTSTGSILSTTGNITSSAGYLSASNVVNAGTQFVNTSTTAITYRTTNGGSNVTPAAFFGSAITNTAGTQAFGFDITNGQTFTAANGTRQIARAGLNIVNLVNTAASESADLAFYTQAAGAAMAERLRITSTAFTVPTDNIYDLGSSTASLKDIYSRTLKLDGSTSGTMTLAVPAVAGTTTLTAPIVTGTITQWVESTTASSATPTPTGDARQNFFTITALATAPTFAAPSGTPANGNELLIRCLDNGTARALAFNAIYRGSTDIALPTTTVLSKTMYMKFIYNSASSTWDMVGLTDGF